MMTCLCKGKTDRNQSGTQRLIRGYFRLRRSFFNEPVVRLLEEEPEGKEKVLLYIKMLHYQSCVGGIVYYGFRENIFDEMRYYFNSSASLMENTYEFLHKYGFAEIDGQVLKVIAPNRTRQRMSKEYKEWRTSVFQRDHFTCQSCKKTGGKLEAHHIKRWVDYPALRFDVSNGITLCNGCHKKIHSKSGE